MNKIISASLILLVILVGCAKTPLPATPTTVPPTLTSTPTPVQVMSTSTPQPTTALPTPTTAQPTPTPVQVVSTPTAQTETATWMPDGVIGAEEYAGRVEAGGVQFYWSTDAEFLYGALSAKTTGWVAVGIDPQNKMQGADYIFGYVKDGQLFIEDMFGTRPFGSDSHPPDVNLGGRNDITESGGRESDGVTVIEFKIPLNSGDAYDKPLRAGQSYKIILAWGSRDDFNSMHGGYGSASIEIAR